MGLGWQGDGHNRSGVGKGVLI